MNRISGIGFLVYGRGKGTYYILSKQFYSLIGEKGTYTRKRGLDTEEKKALIVKHLKIHGKGTFKEFQQVLPSLRRRTINNLLASLKKEGVVDSNWISNKKDSYWYLTEPK